MDDPSSPGRLTGGEVDSSSRRRALSIGRVVVALLLVAAAMYAWKEIATFREQRRVRQDVERRTGELLRLAAVPLAWAVRTEVMGDNLGQVEAYFDRFVKEPHVRRLILADAGGRIVVSTDTSLEGKEAGLALPDTPLDANDVRVETPQEGFYRLVVPVMGFDSRLGTLVVEYAPAIRSSLPARPAPAGPAP